MIETVLLSFFLLLVCVVLWIILYLANDNIDQRGRQLDSQKRKAKRFRDSLQATRRLCGRNRLLSQKVNDKILNRLQLVQHVYYEDYKDQVKQMSD
jgi:hypothetical protein